MFGRAGARAVAAARAGVALDASTGEHLACEGDVHKSNWAIADENVVLSQPGSTPGLISPRTAGVAKYGIPELQIMDVQPGIQYHVSKLLLGAACSLARIAEAEAERVSVRIASCPWHGYELEEECSLAQAPYMNSTESWIKLWVQAAGAGQMLLVLVSPLIPHVLKWREDTRKLRPLTREVFWTYAAYIWATNFWFALICLLLADELLSKTGLAVAVTAFMAFYWGGRLGVQFFYFDRSSAPSGLLPRIGETALTGLFVFLAVTFTAATLYNLRML